MHGMGKLTHIQLQIERRVTPWYWNLQLTASSCRCGLVFIAAESKVIKKTNNQRYFSGFFFQQYLSSRPDTQQSSAISQSLCLCIDIPKSTLIQSSHNCVHRLTKVGKSMRNYCKKTSKHTINQQLWHHCQQTTMAGINCYMKAN